MGSMILKPLSVAVRLRPYQSELLGGIYGAWESGVQNVMAVSPTGSGKTVLFSAALSQHSGAAVAIAHRQELIGQIAAALNRVGVRFRIIAPKPTRALIIKAILIRQGVCHYDPSAEIGVASVASLKNVPTSKQYVADRGWLNRIGLWVNDECFPAGTLVDGVPIETLRPGDRVTAFNERDGVLETRKVVRLFKNPMPTHMVRVKATHHVLTCTPGHPFYTQRGWVAAALLTENDYVLLQDEPLHSVQTSGWGADQVEGDLLPIDRPLVLLDSLLDRVSSPTLQRDREQNKPKVRFRSDEEKEPDALRRNPATDGRDSAEYWTLSEGARGERAAADRGRESTIRATQGPGFSASNRCQDGERLGAGGVPPVLQTGHCPPCDETGYRGGRPEPLLAREAGTRREERRLLSWARLDSIEVFESADTEQPGASVLGNHVYNIEVEGLHTYLANGVVVHNCHHLQADNIWGSALALFPPSARGLGVTATPIRGDGGGLGRTSDGVFDVMTEGPNLADLIDKGYLTPYKVVCAPVSVDYSDIKIGAGGEYVNARLVAAEESSGLTGDIVKTYLKHTPGKLALAFVSSVKRAQELAQEFIDHGVPAAAISGSTPDDERAELIRKLELREILVLTNVEIASEGTDLPAVEVVIMGTKTASLSRFLQWAGRALRLMVDYSNYDDLTDAQRRQRIAESVKPYAWIIDHANNIITHGLPDKPHIWTLDGERKSAGDSDAIALKPCTNPGLELTDSRTQWDEWRKAGWTNELMLEHGHAYKNAEPDPIPCAQPYEAFLRCCEFCGYMPEPKGRRDPGAVEGDLELLDEETMAALRASYAEARRSVVEYRSAIASGHEGRMNHMMASSNVKKHEQKLAEFALLDEAMHRFGGKYKAIGESDSKIQRRFYATFGIDVLTAGTLKRADAEKLRGKIDSHLTPA